MSGSVPCSAHLDRYRSSCSASAAYGSSGGTTTAQPRSAASSYVRSEVPPRKTRNFRSGRGTIPESPIWKCLPSYEKRSFSSAVKSSSTDSS